MGRPIITRRFAWMHRLLLGDILALSIVALVLAIFHQTSLPLVGPASFSLGPTREVSPLPIHIPSPPQSDVKVNFSVRVSRFSPSWYAVQAEDCIETIRIDGEDLRALLPPCEFPGFSYALNLRPYLTPGKHTVEIAVRSGSNDVIGLDFRASRVDPLLLTVKLSILITILVLIHFLSAAYRRHKSKSGPSSELRMPLLRILPRLFVDPAVLAIAVAAVGILAYITIQPRIIAGYYVAGDHVPHLFHGSFSAPHEVEDWYRLHFGIRYGRIRPLTLRLFGDDCVQELMINGLKIPGLQGEVCGYDIGARVPVEHYVHAGINSVQLVVHNAGGAGGLHIKVDPSDPILTALILLIVLFGSVGAWILIRRTPMGADRAVSAIILLAIILRVLYFFATPFYVRANDVDGHIEYAHFIIDHGHLPGMRDTWESFQPPLYYFISAGLMLLSRTFFAAGYDEVSAVQALSPILTIIAFFLAAGILRRALDPSRYRIEFILGLAALAVLPGFIYNAGRVNNDVLVQFFMMAGLYEIIRAFDRNTSRFLHWALAILLLGCGIASKTNALILAPAIVVATPFLFRGQWWKKILLTLLASIVIVGSYLGMYILRHPQKDDVAVTNIVTNSVALNGDLVIPNTTAAYTTFSPVQVLLHPFNDGWTDASRRTYFLEYLYKSAFFGEWGFPDSYLSIGRLVVLAGILCIPLGLYGMLATLARRRSPASLLLIVYGWSILILHGIFRYQYPFSPSQDFRYVSSVALVMAGFAAIGVSALPRRLRPYGIAALTSFVVTSLIFMIQICSLP